MNCGVVNTCIEVSQGSSGKKLDFCYDFAYQLSTPRAPVLLTPLPPSTSFRIECRSSSSRNIWIIIVSLLGRTIDISFDCGHSFAEVTLQGGFQ